MQSILLKHSMTAEQTTAGETEYNVTDEVESFDKTASIFLGEKIGRNVHRVELV